MNIPSMPNSRKSNREKERQFSNKLTAGPKKAMQETRISENVIKRTSSLVEFWHSLNWYNALQHYVINVNTCCNIKKCMADSKCKNMDKTTNENVEVRIDHCEQIKNVQTYFFSKFHNPGNAWRICKKQLLLKATTVN